MRTCGNWQLPHVRIVGNVFTAIKADVDGNAQTANQLKKQSYVFGIVEVKQRGVAILLIRHVATSLLSPDDVQLSTSWSSNVAANGISTLPAKVDKLRCSHFAAIRACCTSEETACNQSLTSYSIFVMQHTDMYSSK